MHLWRTYLPRYHILLPISICNMQIVWNESLEFAITSIQYIVWRDGSVCGVKIILTIHVFHQRRWQKTVANLSHIGKLILLLLRLQGCAWTSPIREWIWILMRDGFVLWMLWSLDGCLMKRIRITELTIHHVYLSDGREHTLIITHLISIEIIIISMLLLILLLIRLQLFWSREVVILRVSILVRESFRSIFHRVVFPFWRQTLHLFISLSIWTDWLLAALLIL